MNICLFRSTGRRLWFNDQPHFKIVRYGLFVGFQPADKGLKFFLIDICNINTLSLLHRNHPGDLKNTNRFSD